METSNRGSLEEGHSNGKYMLFGYSKGGVVPQGNRKVKGNNKNEQGKHREEEENNESLEGMVQALKQQLQQQKSRVDKFIVNWQSCEDG